MAASDTSSSTSGASKKEEISQAEAELYDRQIRLWGLDAQNRLRNSSVLLVGLSGLGAEVAKNLMLSGIKSLMIMDDKAVMADDFSSQFLIAPGSLGQNRAEASKHKTQILNPMVELIVSTESLELKPDSFFGQFNLVILIDQSYELVNKINKVCRAKGIRFQAGSVYGWMGFAFFDCNNHLFLLPKPKEQPMLNLSDDEEDENAGPSRKKAKFDNGFTVTTVEDDEEQKIQQKVAFSSFESAFNINWNSKQIARRLRTIIPSTFFLIRALLTKMNSSTQVENDITPNDLFEAYKAELTAAKMSDFVKMSQPEDFSFFMSPQLSPVCAIVGSIIGQEAIKALSQNDIPLKNVFIYSALETSGIVCDLPPKIGPNKIFLFVITLFKIHFFAVESSSCDVKSSDDNTPLVSDVNTTKPATNETVKAFGAISKLEEYEKLFKNRYTDQDEDYLKCAARLDAEPVMIYPYPPRSFHNVGRGGRGWRGGYNQRYGRGNRDYNSARRVHYNNNGDSDARCDQRANDGNNNNNERIRDY